jgi:type II secretory pathway pseudopilin PulG
MEITKPSSKRRVVTLPGLAALLIVLLLLAGSVIPGGPGRAAYMASTQNKIAQLESAMENYRIEYGTIPVGNDNATFVRAIEGDNARGLVFIYLKPTDKNSQGEMLDAWKTPLHVNGDAYGKIHIRSAGPDKVFGTADDISATANEGAQR